MAIDETSAHGHGYDFDSMPLMRDGRSWKWMTHAKDVIPMWVADMDFRSPNMIRDSLARRAQANSFPYEIYSTSLYEALSSWAIRQFSWTVAQEEIRLSPGTISGIEVILKTLARNSRVVVCPPIYPELRRVARDQDGTSIEIPWTVDDAGWHLDMDRLDQTLLRGDVLLICHPHNPLGRELCTSDLEALAEIVCRRGVVVVSNELWADLVLDGVHRPFASIGAEAAERTVTVLGPSKSFNIAGLRVAAIVCTGRKLRRRLWPFLDNRLPEVNSFGLAAAEAAWRHGHQWITALRAYLCENRDLLVSRVRSDCPGVILHKPDAGYLAWLDFNFTTLATNPTDYLLDYGRVALTDGGDFGARGFVRLNFACPRSRLNQGIDRISSCLRRGA